MNDACTASDRLQRLPAVAAAADPRMKAVADKIESIMKILWVVNAAGGECGWRRSEEAIIVWFVSYEVFWCLVCMKMWETTRLFNTRGKVSVFCTRETRL
jgi:hypothetical protein